MTFTIDTDNNITAHATPEEAAAATATPFDSFSTEQELAELAGQWPAERLVAILNSLPGEKPVKKLKDPKTAASRIWRRIQGLGDAAKPEAAPAKPKTGKKSKGRAQSAKGAPATAKTTKNATPAKKTHKARKAAKAEAAAPRQGSKTELVISMLKRKNGATLSAIMEKTGWLSHTTRAFVSATLGKKLGLAVESFKPEGGERSYRINE